MYLYLQKIIVQVSRDMQVMQLCEPDTIDIIDYVIGIGNEVMWPYYYFHTTVGVVIIYV